VHARIAELRIAQAVTASYRTGPAVLVVTYVPFEERQPTPLQPPRRACLASRLALHQHGRWSVIAALTASVIVVEVSV